MAKRKRNEVQVFKFQRALNNNRVLAYNRNRSVMGEFPITEELDALFGDELKIYCRCKHRKDGQLEILDIAEPQDW